MGLTRSFLYNLLKSTLLVSLFAIFSPAFANEDTSPVQIFDIPGWIRVRDQAKANPKVVSLKLMIEIIYDRITSRPIEEQKYWPLAGTRWTNFRSVYCPSKLTLCSLPAELINMGQLEAIRDGFVKESNRDLINIQLNAIGLHMSPNLIFPVQLTVADSDKKNFSFRITSIESEESSDVQDKTLTVTGHVIMNDILTYRMAFNREMAKTYFAVDSKGNGYIQGDRVKEAAMGMARQWKRAAEMDIEYTTIDAADLLLQSLKKELSNEFEATYTKLVMKLDPNNRNHIEHIHRFFSARLESRYPIEVYQWMALEQLSRVTEILVRHYQLAKLDYQNLHVAERSVKALADVQEQTSPRLMFYLLQRQWDYEDGGVIEQITSKPLVGMYMVEHLQVLLEQGPYKDEKNFAKLSRHIDYNLLANDHEFLKSHNPEFYKKMSALGLLGSEKLRAAPLAVQQTWLQEFITKDQVVFNMGVYRLAAALMMGVDARESRHIAQTIRRARLAKQDNEL